MLAEARAATGCHVNFVTHAVCYPRVMFELVLSEAALAWLADRGLVAVPLDLQETYSFSHEAVTARFLTRLEVKSHSLLWAVMLHCDGESILDRNLARRLVQDWQLASRPEKGLIAYNAEFYLKEEFRRRRVASTVYPREFDLYRRWGVPEIHMMAQEQGRLVWLRQFGFRPPSDVAVMLQTEYAGWAEKRGLSTTAPIDPIDYPDEFLLARHELKLFKVVQ